MSLNQKETILEEKCQISKNKYVKDNIFINLKKQKLKNYSQYQIDISIPKENKRSMEYYDFILLINLVKNSIILFSLNINPISDGRDIFPIVTKASKLACNYDLIEELNISDIIKNIIDFIKLENFSNLNGIFYLNELYDENIINNLKNIEKIKCIHMDMINGKQNDIISLCTISDEHFCLYEKDKEGLNLVFYSNIKNLLAFKKNLNVVTLNWKKKIVRKENEIKYISIELKIYSNIENDMGIIMDLLIDKLNKIGLQTKINEQKSGILPDLDVDKTEGEIFRLESQLNNKDNILVFNKLLEKYEQIIEYFSAANNSKYNEYNTKMKELLTNEKYAKYIK